MQVIIDYHDIQKNLMPFNTLDYIICNIGTIAIPNSVKQITYFDITGVHSSIKQKDIDRSLTVMISFAFLHFLI